MTINVDGDRPITTKEDDRLGFTPVAEHLAHAIADETAPDGLVFGIEGRWGSGKSTLINLTIEALRRIGGRAPEIITFSPWLVGERDELLRTLFDELATAAVKIDPVDTADQSQPNSTATGWGWKRRGPDEHWKLKQREELKQGLGTKLQTFGAVTSTLGKLARAGGAMGIPLADLMGTALERSADAAQVLAAGGSISKRKMELIGALKLLSRPIVVFVDDLDRLEPREAVEVLRLIRAVADFPNIIYVLSYDPTVVAQTLSKAVQVDDGAAFLEKIVQVSFRVPRPEAYDLRRWLWSEVQKLFAEELQSSPSDQSIPQRLARAIEVQGGRYLKTPRDVVRVLNALRLHGLPVRSRIDVPDMVWLQLVRIGNPDLYAWVEEYLVDVSAVSNGAVVTTDSARSMAQRMQQLLQLEDLEVIRAIMDLQEILPGLLPPEQGQTQIRVYQDLNKLALEPLVAARRLGSPQHYRYYFAFSQPSGTVSDVEVTQFIETAARSPEDALLLFTTMSRVARPQGGNAAEVLMDRLAAIADKIPATAIGGIVRAFAQTMDAPEFSHTVRDFGVRLTWHVANRIVELLLPRTSDDQRKAVLRQLFAEGGAIGWLTHILRGEIFAHGHHGDRPTPPERWLLTTDEFNEALATMLRRYREMPPAALSQVPNFLSLLYAWKQGSGTDEARDWVTAFTATDQGLLTFLSSARSWTASTARGVYYPLKREEVQPFIDVDAAIARVNAIIQRATATTDEKNRARELLNAFAQGESL
jgi:hypothetical protein